MNENNQIMVAIKYKNTLFIVIHNTSNYMCYSHI